MENHFGSEYASTKDTTFIPKYKAACFCGAVTYEVSADPVDAKICHCMVCQRLHGAPMQWAAIFHKRHVRLTAGLNYLVFYIKTKQNEFCPAKSSVVGVGLQLLMRGVECGLPSHRCLTLVSRAKYRIHLNQPAIFSMVLELLSIRMVCPSGPGTKSILLCCNMAQVQSRS